MPLPHIFASLPSALKIRILKSAFSDGEIQIIPSAPAPKCLSESRTASASGSTGSP